MGPLTHPRYTPAVLRILLPRQKNWTVVSWVLLVQLRNTEENRKGLHDGWLLGTSPIFGVKTVFFTTSRNRLSACVSFLDVKGKERIQSPRK